MTATAGTAQALRMEGADSAVLRVDGLRVWFPILSAVLQRRTGWMRAVDGIDLSIGPGETLALVGESGSGKTTTGKAIVRVQDVTEGRISLLGQDITALQGRELRRRRGRLQMIFQDPTGSLNPRRTVGQVLRESLVVHGVERSALHGRTKQLLDEVGLGPQHQHRLPHELSGGQRQRVGIARALSTGPSLVVCDEPVSSLDVSIQAQILTLLGDLQRQHGLSYLFISHDLGVVRVLAHRVAVMYRGRIVEYGPVEDVLDAPAHPYTIALVSAVPTSDPDAPRRARIPLAPAGGLDTASTGCAFRDRCWLYEALGRPADCADTAPELSPSDPSGRRRAACHHIEARSAAR
jgi:oligopeptide/dipeptide ABC transporter ATP-binding protein